MAKFTSGASCGLTTPQYQACRMLAEGKDYEDVLNCVFRVWKDSEPAERKKAEKTLRDWVRKEGFQACFRGIVKENALPKYSKAANKLYEQIDSDNAWIANKAANDVLTRFGPYVMGAEEQQITVRVEGLPELGVPDDND